MEQKQSEQMEALYFELYDKLFVYARCNLDSDGHAEEAVQETFRIACQKPDALCHSPNPRGWLVNTLKNVISNMRHNQNTDNRIMAEYLAFQMRDAAIAEDGVRFEVLYENLAELEEYQLLREFYVEGYSHLEMAEKRGITVAACKKRVQRAKEVLQRKIKK